MSKNLEQYRKLLDRYHVMIFTESWWDGRREKLVDTMDKLWECLSNHDRELVLQYATELYLRRISG